MANEKRLIDANARIEEIKEAQCTGCENYGGIRCRACWVDDAIGLIDDSPTVDAVEVVHGRWEWYTDRCEDLFLGCDDDYGWRCSCCETPLEDCDDPEMPPTLNYCPNCGAKMDGGNEDV